MAIPKPLPYIEAFEKLGFGMFIHWGLYSQIGKGEWHYRLEYKGTMEEYTKLMDTFTAEDFDAEDIVKTAKEAGCKYIVLTTRHHEGFSLYDTCGLNEYDAPHSPAGRDLIREYVDACNKYDIKPFFYHTTLDWYNPDFENDFDKYLDYLNKSVEILCKNYGKIGGLWFDGNWSKPDADWKEDALYATIRKYQPEAMIINNTGMGKRGAVGNPEIDSITFEQGLPTPINREGWPKYLAGEMCETMGQFWGIGEFDLDMKSPRELITHLCNCRKVGANYLLNIGPTAQGGIQPIQKEILKLIGRWMKVNGEAIYDAKPYIAKGFYDSFALKSDDAIYFVIPKLAQWGDSNVVQSNGFTGPIAFGGVDKQIKSIKWLDTGEDLEFSQVGDNFTFKATGYGYGNAGCVRIAKATY